MNELKVEKNMFTFPEETELDGHFSITEDILRQYVNAVDGSWCQILKQAKENKLDWYSAKALGKSTSWRWYKRSNKHHV